MAAFPEVDKIRYEGPETDNPRFQKATPFPFTPARGAALDVTRWRAARPLTIEGAEDVFTLTLPPEDLSALMDSVTVGPNDQIEVDLEAREVRHRGTTWALAIPDGTRDQLLEGTWNATAVLLGAGDAIEATAEQLPYVSGFQA